MKSVLALVVILHLCDSFNTALNAELISHLRPLKRPPCRTTLTPPVHRPSKYMSENPHACAGVFFRELRNVLNNLLVHSRCKDSIKMLLANLDSQSPFPMDDQNCRMENQWSKRLPVVSYIDFVTKLNTVERSTDFSAS